LKLPPADALLAFLGSKEVAFDLTKALTRFAVSGDILRASKLIIS